MSSINCEECFHQRQMTTALDKTGMQKNMGSLKKKKTTHIYIYLSETYDEITLFFNSFLQLGKGDRGLLKHECANS